MFKTIIARFFMDSGKLCPGQSLPGNFRALRDDNKGISSVESAIGSDRLGWGIGVDVQLVGAEVSATNYFSRDFSVRNISYMVVLDIHLDNHIIIKSNSRSVTLSPLVEVFPYLLLLCF